MRASSLSSLSEKLTPSLVPEAPSADADMSYDALVAFHGIERERLVLIHPGSHKDAPAWSAERYADVADQLAADGWQIAIVGDAPDPERTAGVLGAMQTAALFLAGAVAPRTLPRLIADARLLLSDDAAAPSPVAKARALGTPHIVLDEHPRDTDSAAILTRARAELSDTRDAHPGRPFTLHMPAEHDAIQPNLAIMKNMNFELQTTPVPDPIADPNRDPEADPLTPPSPGHRPDEPQHPEAPPDKDPITRF